MAELVGWTALFLVFGGLLVCIGGLLWDKIAVLLRVLVRKSTSTGGSE
jgi:hypothetical protein